MVRTMNPLKSFLDAEGRGAQARLAREIGCSRGTIGDIASGRRNPTLALARALDRASGGRVAFEKWKDAAQSANPFSPARR